MAQFINIDGKTSYLNSTLHCLFNCKGFLDYFNRGSWIYDVRHYMRRLLERKQINKYIVDNEIILNSLVYDINNIVNSYNKDDKKIDLQNMLNKLIKLPIPREYIDIKSEKNIYRDGEKDVIKFIDIFLKFIRIEVEYKASYKYNFHYTNKELFEKSLNKYSQEQWSIVKDLFGFQIAVINSLEKKIVTTVYPIFFNISIYCNSESDTDNNLIDIIKKQWFNQKSDIYTISQYFFTIPKNLIIYLIRKEYKINVVIPLMLDITDLKHPEYSQSNQLYELYAVIYRSNDSSHYVSYIKKNDKWFKDNTEEIKDVVNFKNNADSVPCVIFYKRIL